METPSELLDKDYRDEFVSANIETGVAFQLRALREKAGLKQGQLAEKMGTQQSVIARLENPGYGKFSLQTLVKYANFFDVGLLVRFVSFRELLRNADNSSPKALEVPTFEEEYKQSHGLLAVNAENSAAKAVYDQAMNAARAGADQAKVPPRDVSESLKDKIYGTRVDQPSARTMAAPTDDAKPEWNSVRTQILH